MTIPDPYKEIHALREKIAKMYDEFAGTPSERIRHMEEVAELREESQKLEAEKSEILRIVDGLNSATIRYRKALEEIRKSAEYPDSPMEHQIYEIAQGALDDE